MGNWDEVADGEKIDVNKYLDFREYATTALRDTASASFGSSELFHICRVVETGYYYYWNGAAWSRFPAAGGAGAPTDASYVTINAEGGLSAETQHQNIAEAYKHTPKAHAASHQNAGADEISVAGLSGVLADGQNAAKIKGKNVDTPISANTYPKYNGVDIDWVALPGGGDMTKAVYDTDDDGQVNMAEDSLKLDGNTLATVRTHTPQGHKTSHEDGGSDEIDVAGLSGELAQAQTPKAHAASHQNAGSDEISVTGLNGVLADEQDAGLIKGKVVDTAGLADNDFLQYDLASDKWKPETLPGGGDMLKAVYDANANSKVDVAEDSELLEGSTKAQVQTHAPQAHAASHQNAGSDEISVTGLSGLLADEQDAGKIKGVTVDNAGIGNDKALVYKSASGNIEYASAAGSGDMTKAVYDANDDGVVEDSDKLEANTLAQVRNHTPIAHKDTHKTGGGDAFLSTDTLDGIARTTIRKNTGANVGSRRRINFIEGSGVGLTVTDDAANEEVDVNISVSGGGTYKLVPSYTVYKVGSYYYAMDPDGTVPYSGTVFHSVMESACNALVGAASDGGIVNLLPGTYTLTDDIDITPAAGKGRLWIRGSGEATDIHCTSANKTCFDIVGAGTSYSDRMWGVWLSDFQLRGGASDTYGVASQGIRLKNGNRCKLWNIYTKWFSEEALEIDLVQGLNVANCYYRYCGDTGNTKAGIYIHASTSESTLLSFDHCEFARNAYRQIWDSGSDYLSIRDAYFEGETDSSEPSNEHVYSNAYEFVIERFHMIRGAQHGVRYYKTGGVGMAWIYNGRISQMGTGAADSCVYIDGSANQVVIDGINFGNSHTGVYVRTDNCYIDNNYWHSNLTDDLNYGGNKPHIGDNNTGLAEGNYQVQTGGAWANPIGPIPNGRKVTAYNSNLGQYRVYTVANGAWRYASLT